jgi:hypothetical protein
MHHWKPSTKNVNALESSPLKDSRAPFALEEGESQQHEDQRAEIERARYELLGKFEWWIGANAFTAGGSLPLHKKINST